MVDSLHFLLSLCNVSSKCLLVRLLTIALHCIALVFTCKILMINKRGRCFNHDPVSPSKTLLERTSLAWKHGKQLQIFILKMVGSCFSCLLQAWEPHHAPEPAAPSLAKPFHALLCRG